MTKYITLLPNTQIRLPLITYWIILARIFPRAKWWLTLDKWFAPQATVNNIYSSSCHQSLLRVTKNNFMV